MFQPVRSVWWLKSREYFIALPESLYQRFSMAVVVSATGSREPKRHWSLLRKSWVSWSHVADPLMRSVWNQSSGEPFKYDRMKETFAVLSGKSAARRMIYSEHWRMKVSSFIGSELSKVSGACSLACVVGCGTGGRLVCLRCAEISSSTLRRRA